MGEAEGWRVIVDVKDFESGMRLGSLLGENNFKYETEKKENKIKNHDEENQESSEVRNKPKITAPVSPYEEDAASFAISIVMDSLEKCQLRMSLNKNGDGVETVRPATTDVLEGFAKEIHRKIDDKFREEVRKVVSGCPIDAWSKTILLDRFLNDPSPDLEKEEQEKAEYERMEREERRIAQDAIAQHRDARNGRDEDHDDDADSTSSALTAEEQKELVLALRESLTHRSAEGMEPRHQRMVVSLRRALDEYGGISREEIMRYRVEETSRANRERQDPDRNSPYSVSSVVISRMSLGEIRARADAIRALSTSHLYPLEASQISARICQSVYYQLHLADVLWPLAGREIALGDSVYTQDEINEVLGADSPIVPAGADGDDFHQLMRKRAITTASLIGREYGMKRGREGFQYQPPRLPDMGIYQLFGDVSVLQLAIDGDMEPLREAIERIPMMMPDVMRLDLRTEQTLGSHLRNFRDYLDSRARMVGFELRDDIYQDEVPEEPTGSLQPDIVKEDEDEEDGDRASNDDPNF